MDIVLGDHNRWFMDGNEQIIPAARVIPHPNYESWLVNNDIMLIKLSKPATINQYVQPVALPTSCAPAGTMCTVSGWGVTMSSCEFKMLSPYRASATQSSFIYPCVSGSASPQPLIVTSCSV